MKINKLWAFSFFSFGIIVIVMLFYAAVHDDTYDAIEKAILNLKPKDVKSISLIPKNITITDNQEVSTFLKAIQSMKAGGMTKGVTVYRDVIMILHLTNPERLSLKNKSDIELLIHETQEGLFIEMTNVWGDEIFLCSDLKAPLEKHFNYKTP